MTVQFQNYSHSYLLAGKPVFAPSELGRRIGQDVKLKIERECDFEHFFYHLRTGGHVAALHSHRRNEYFCKLDIENYFYSIGRSRVVRCLKQAGIPRAAHYAKWSCVKNPYCGPRYSLPYGFVQSPILATLALALSTLGDTLRRLESMVRVSVYVDDIALSSNDLAQLCDCFEELYEGLISAGFQTNDAKTVSPSKSLEVFNCSLQKNATSVLPTRIEKFFDEPRTEASEDSFRRYCTSVSNGNI